LIEKKVAGEIYNVCGDGLIPMREIARLAGRELNLSALPPDATPRIVEASNEKIRKLFSIPKTADSIREFVGRKTN
jgi:nucleoside-diphosphate-sugar epimerase